MSMWLVALVLGLVVCVVTIVNGPSPLNALAGMVGVVVGIVFGFFLREAIG